MRARLVALASVALLAAGCGSGGGGGAGDASSDAAQLAPADSLAYVTVDTDFSSGQLRSAQAILDKFPIKERLLRSVRSSLRRSGTNVGALKSSIGPEVDVAVVRVNGKTSAVGFTQPRDEKAFDAQLDKQSAVHATIDGWTAFADTQPFLDAVKNRTANLSDAAAYQAAAKTIPDSGDAIVRVYAAPGGLQAALGAASSNLGAAGSSLGSFGTAKWVTAALSSQDGAFKLDVHARSSAATIAPASGAGLAAEIPSGSILALSLTGGGGAVPAKLQPQIAGLGRQLGLDLGSLLEAFRGPVIAYVRAGLPLPEVTLAARPPHPARTLAAVRQLLTRFLHPQAPPVPTRVDGGTLQKVDLGSIALYFGVNAGQLVVTDSANALAELKGSVGHLTGDGVFKEAKDGAGMPDGTQGFLFLDLKDAVPALTGFAQLANQKIPANVEANLKPLRSLLVFGSRDAGVQSFTVYLKTS